MMQENELSGQSPVARGHEIMVISAILYILLFCFSGLLVFTRIRLRCFFSTDGIFYLIAMIPTSLYFVATLLSNDDFHWNRHLYDIPPASLENGFKMVFAAEIMFVAACTLAKLSIMMLVRRIMSSASSFWRGLSIFAIIVVSIQGVVSCFLVSFQCGSPQKFWESSRETCTNHSSTLLASGIINTITDIFVILLPVPSVLSFQLSQRQKAIVLFIFGLGLASTGAGISRTYFLSQAARKSDFTWAYYPVWLSSSFQLYLGMICAAIPPLKLFFSTYIPSLLGPTPMAFDPDYSSQRLSIHRKQSVFSGTTSSGEEELLDFEKGGSGVTTSTVASRTRVNQGLSEEDREYIKITQQTVVQISRVGEV